MAGRDVTITDERTLLDLPRKDGAEALRVIAGKCNGYDFVQIREWYKTPEGEWRPGKRGISVKPRELRAVIDALTKAGGSRA